MAVIRELKDYTGPKTCRNFGKVEDLVIETEKGNAYDRAVAHKDIIRVVLTGDYDISELKDLVDQGIESMYSLEATNNAVKDKEVKNLYRYLSQETRKPVYVKKTLVDIGHDEISIASKPDCLFVDTNNFTVEAVSYRSGSPTINNRTGIKADKVENLKEWFKLWVNLKLAKEYAEKNFALNIGDVYTVKSSFYFMKKSTDSNAVRDNDFFSGKGGNIVSLEDRFCFGAPQVPTDEDRLFYKFIDDADAGLECTDKDCEACVGKSACKYTKAPVKLNKKETTKKRAKITPSDSQLSIINAIEGIFKVNATAGSGKTECMTERSKRLFQAGVNPKEVLHISFTDAAVGEMKDRISGKCLSEGINVTRDDIECYTFNAFANKAIGSYYEELGYKSAPKILSAEYELSTIEGLIDSNPISGIDAGSVMFSGSGNAIESVIIMAQKTFNIIKSKRIDVNSPDASDNLVPCLREAGIFRSMTYGSVTDLLKLYKEYDRILKEDCFVTYADQEPLMFKVLEMHPEYFDNLGYKHIIVDEFQDSNEIQLETLRKLIDTPNFKSLMVVGDDSQAIYAFRDTTPEYIINFEKYIGKPVTDLFLTENRRSTPEIIKLANDINNLNENKVCKDMIATREDGVKPVVRGFYSKKEEYAYIASEIEKKIKNGADPDSIAFIASKKTELQEIGTLLTKAGIPWVMKNPMDLMENSRVIGALSIADAFYQPEATSLYFNYLCAKYDGELLNRFTTDEINVMIKDMKAQFETIYLRDMAEQRSIFHRYLEDIKKAADDELYDYFLSLVYDNDDLPSELEYTRIFKKYGSKMAKKMDQSYEGVVLTTAHSSKGLEWPTVFVSISSFDSERLHKTASRYVAEKEEKRRLLFVATTRARDELIVTGQYVAYGPKDDRTFNQFLRELYILNGQEKAYVPVDPMEAIRDAERREKARAKQREKYYEKKKNDNSSARSLSDDEKREYDNLVRNSKQMVLPF